MAGEDEDEEFVVVQDAPIAAAPNNKDVIMARRGHDLDRHMATGAGSATALMDQIMVGSLFLGRLRRLDDRGPTCTCD
jgi:hypothetical protein